MITRSLIMETTLFLPIIDPPLDQTTPDLSSCAAARQWKIVGDKNHHGINLPLFSLRSQKSGGIGEYSDLIPMIHWCKEIGFDTLQLLPLNDTGPDTSPYNSMTANGLNPLFIGLAALEDFDTTHELIQSYHDLQALNTLKHVDYSKVSEGKDRFLQAYFLLKKDKILGSSDYQNFLKTHVWLDDFAIFKTLKEQNNWKAWCKWDPSIQPNSDRIIFHKFCQYLCFQQLEQVKRTATDQGVFLKGDIPILISKESSDVWKNPNLFYLDFSAGAPPDMYSEEGQFWGFPLYNWKEMQQQGYRWWRDRLVTTTPLYHIYRIDHIVGFFRIWTIPNGMKAQEGHFVPVNQSSWVSQGERIMQMMLDSSCMLPIGEDLGVVPNRVKNCLTALGICGTKVMRWEKRWSTNQSYILPTDYPKLSMTTVSTHDSETLYLWWQNQPKEAQEYSAEMQLSYTPQLSPETQLKILRQSHQSNSIFHVNLLQEYLTLFKELSWENPEDERINVPGTFNEKNWTYRFRPTIEEITSHRGLKEAIQSCL